MIEMTMALSLGTLILALVWASFTKARSLAANRSARVEWADATRTAWWILRQELRAGDPQAGAVPLAGDSLRLRLFRGHGVACPGSWKGGERLIVGLGLGPVRLPAPEKDSILVLGADGRWSAHDLVARAGRYAGCAGVPEAERWEEWRLAPTPSVAPVLLRFFETGSYHLRDGALRFRIGAGGRQPLTPELFDRDSTGLESAPTGVRAELDWAPRGGGEGREGWTRRGTIHRRPGR